MQDWTTTQDAREYAINMLLLMGLFFTCFGIAIIGRWLLQWWQTQSRKVDTLLTDGSSDDLDSQQHAAQVELPATVSHASSDEEEEDVPEDFADMWHILEQAAWHHAKPYQRHWQRTHGNPGYFTRQEVLLLCQLEERYHRGDYYPEWRQEDGGRVA